MHFCGILKDLLGGYNKSSSERISNFSMKIESYKSKKIRQAAQGVEFMRISNHIYASNSSRRRKSGSFNLNQEF